MTFRGLINEVLIRLREDTIASDWSGDINDSTTISAYQKVIGSLVNDAKRHVEERHDWLNLRETVDIATVNGTENYNLSSGQEIKIMDAVNNTTGMHLRQVGRTYINRSSITSKYLVRSLVIMFCHRTYSCTTRSDFLFQSFSKSNTTRLP